MKYCLSSRGANVDPDVEAGWRVNSFYFSLCAIDRCDQGRAL
jgi:hypothetical protein